jgi:hypothetical protein
MGLRAEGLKSSEYESSEIMIIGPEMSHDIMSREGSFRGIRIETGPVRKATSRRLSRSGVLSCRVHVVIAQNCDEISWMNISTKIQLILKSSGVIWA